MPKTRAGSKSIELKYSSFLYDTVSFAARTNVHDKSRLPDN